MGSSPTLNQIMRMTRSGGQFNHGVIVGGDFAAEWGGQNVTFLVGPFHLL